MVCKEDVLSWFKDLESYERIDLMYALLNMCIPFELRFLGTCVEEIGKHSFQELRGAAINANDLERLAKEFSVSKDLFNTCTRHRITIYISLLQSRSFVCANWIFNYVLKTDWIDSFINSAKSKADKNVHNELLLLFTLALNHPAFTFEHKLYFGQIVTRLLEQNEVKSKVACTLNLNQCQLQGVAHAKPQIPQTAHHISVRGLVADSGAMPPPPGFQQPAAPATQMPLEYTTFSQQIPAWSRPFTSSAAYQPDSPQYPPPLRPVSPLVSQQTSPAQSRPSSPPPARGMRPQSPRHVMRPPPPPQHFVMTPDLNVPPPPLQRPSNYSPELKNTVADELSQHIEDDKLRETPWLCSGPPMSLPPNHKMANGNAPPPHYRTYLEQQLQDLQLEGDSSLHCSSSSASSHSTSPPDTPSSTPLQQQHCPGRGQNAAAAADKTLSNGVAESLPPQSYVPYPASHIPPPRSVFCHPPSSYHHHHHRPPPPPYYQPNGNEQQLVFSYPSYVPLLYSSGPPPPQHMAAQHAQAQPPPNCCFNCGSMGHLGDGCKEQCIEEIMQRNGYQLDYKTDSTSSAAAATSNNAAAANDK